jgi:D-alanyl-D-alanine carboxypeptidase
MGYLRFFSVIFLAFLLLFCTNKNSTQKKTGEEVNDMPEESNFSSVLSGVLANADLPQNISLKIQEGIAANPGFILDLFGIMQDDPYLWILVDKEHSLPENYEPDDLVELTNGSYRVNRDGLLLRSAAAASLEEMAAAAGSEGLTLTASSTYRTYSYQVQVYERNVREMGREAADRESARPGHSQHQLGLVVDFGSITDAFAKTAEGRWLAANASRFGWSLSYPEDCEEITGYRWESWHYRYTGRELAEFIDSYFDGIQQYALRFLHEWGQASAPRRGVDQ